MFKEPEVARAPMARVPGANGSAWIVRVTLAVIVVVFGTVAWYAFKAPGSVNFHATTSALYPVGIPDTAAPSGDAPPAANAISGYTLKYESDFPGHSLPKGWSAFAGVPGGDKGGQFGVKHVVVSDGLLQLNTWQDPAYGMKWVTGGVCQCGLPHTYGAYFVRSRITGPGPNEVELLWPQADVWPPEIDFNETGGKTTETSSTLHYGVQDNIDQRSVRINMSQWHTWGVIWTPTSVKYVVDGAVWGSISTRYEISKIPMTLDLEQRAECQMGRQCPSHPVSMLVNWVAEYAKK